MQIYTLVKKLVNIVTLSFFFFIPALLFGQQYTLHYFGQADGLKFTHSHNVIKDRQGYIWISTGNGIRRYDGQRFLTFNSGANADIPCPVGNINQIFLLKNGNLALVEDHQHIGLFNPYNFHYRQLDLSPYYTPGIKNISANQFSDSLLYINIQSSDGVTVLTYDGHHLNKIYREKQVHRKVSSLLAQYQNPVYIVPFKAGQYLFFDAQEGYFILDKKTGKPRRLQLPASVVKKDPWPGFMVCDARGHCLISFGSIPGMFTLNSKEEVVPDKHFNEGVEYRYVSSGGNGKLIFSVYSDSAMYFVKYDPADQRTQKIRGISFSRWAVMKAWSDDVDHHLYISGDEGLIYADAPDYRIKAYLVNAPKNAVGMSIRGMAKLNNQQVLVSTERSGLFLYDPVKGTTRPLSVPKSWPMDLKPVTFCRNMLKGPDGKVYLSAFDSAPKRVVPGSYLIIYDPRHGFQQYVKLPFRIENLVWENDSTILAPTQAHLYRIGLRPKIHYQLIRLAPQIRDRNHFFIEKMVRVGQYIYMASNEGLFRYSLDSGMQKMDLPGVSVQQLLDVFPAPDGSLWIGSEGGGLYHYFPGKGTLQQYGSRQGIASDMVCGVMTADSAHLWVSTYNGLYLLNKKGGYARTVRDEQGIPHHEFNRYSYLKLNQRNWLFGTMNGFIHVERFRKNDPDQHLQLLFSSVQYRPKGHHTDTVIYSPSRGAALVLPATRRWVRLTFGILHPGFTGESKLYYRLLPLQREWNEMPESNRLIFDYLAPGKYRLQLAFHPNKPAYEMQFKAGYFIYEHWWFRVLVGVLILLAATYWIYIFFDRRLAREKARQLNENENFRRRLLTYIVHEFKTPLTVITGVSGKLRQEDMKPAWKEDIESLQRQGEQMNELVEQMMELNQIDAGSWKPELTAVDIPVFIGRIYAQLQSLADDMKIKMLCSSSVRSSVQLTDVSKLRSVLNNLITNALKYSPTDMTVGLLFDQSDTEWSITVRDQGPGISEGDMAQIFELFYKGKESIEKRMSHSGVGLAYVKTAVEALEGRLEVYNDDGAVFQVFFPLKSTEVPMLEKPKAVVVPEPSKETDQAGLYQVLLVEDNDEIARYVQSCFATHKFKVTWKRNGREGLSYALEHIPDLVITDARMPEMNGFELVRYLKKNDVVSHIPVIMLTALSGESNRLKGLEVGADAYVSKPFHEKELILTVDNLLNTIERQKNVHARLLTGQSGEKVTDEDPQKETTTVFIREAYDSLAKNYADSRFGIAEMADQLHMNRIQLNRKFKSMTGLSPSDTLRKYRLNRAAQMLTDISLSISEITYACGFNDSSYFSKLFAKEFGLSPSAYRAQLQ